MKSVIKMLMCLAMALCLMVASPVLATDVDVSTDIPPSTGNTSTDFRFGVNAPNITMNINSGGILTAQKGYIGLNVASTNVSVNVNAGGVWTNASDLYVGYSGSDNILTISNGGQVFFNYGNGGGVGKNSGNRNRVYVGSSTGVRSLLDGRSASANRSFFVGSAGSTDNRITVDRDGVVIITNNMAIYFGGIGNNMIITNGGLVYDTCFIGANTVGCNSNYVIVAGANGTTNSSWIGGATIGYDATDIGNWMTVSSGGIFTNGYVTINGVGGTLTVTNGGQVFCTGGVIGNSVGASNNCVIIASANGTTNSLCDIGGQFLTIGSNNWMTVSNGGVLTNGYVKMSGIGGALTVTNGGQVFFTTATTIPTGTGASSNNVIIAGANGTTKSLLSLNGLNLTVGNNASGNGNSLNVIGGGMVTNLNILTVGGNSTASNNMVQLAGGGLLEIKTGITVGSGGNNTLTNQGGILQFTIAVPTITTNVGGNVIVMNGGTLGYRGIQSGALPKLTDNLAASSIGNLVWLGNNTLRLNNCLATNSLVTGYVFGTGQPNGAQNFGALELVDGTTAVNGNHPLTIDSTGSLLVSNTTATFGSVLTNNSASVNLVGPSTIAASGGMVWLNGSMSTTTVGLVISDITTTNVLSSGAVTFCQLAGATQQVNGVVSGAGNLLKTGAGVLILAGSNIYSGVTTVSNGTLTVNGSVNSAVNVAAGGILNGTGTVYGVVTNSGAIVATINGNGTASGPVVNGNLVLQGAYLSLINPNNLSGNNIYVVVTYTGTRIGQLDPVLSNLPTGWRISYSVPGEIVVRPGYPGTIFMCQ